MSNSQRNWENNVLQNNSQVLRSSNSNLMAQSRNAPILPPLPRSLAANSYNYMPYSSGFNSMGYGSYGMPYRGSMYGNYGNYSSYGGYSSYGYPSYSMDDAERRFIQYAEERSRNAFANVESIVRVFSSISMMLDNTFFAMTSSFRAVLSVAENFGKLRTMFGQIWHTINLFRLFKYLYRKLMWLMGRKVPNSATSMAWKQAIQGANPDSNKGYGPGSSWPTFAFLGMLLSIPYLISKFLPKYEDKSEPSSWKSPGIPAKAAFDFMARSQNELTLNTNDIITLAPTYIQDEMNLRNTGWGFAVSSDGSKSGVVPLNYLVIIKKSLRDDKNIENNNISSNLNNNNNSHKTHTKRVSFGENQIFENFDLDDYVTEKKIEIKTTNNKVEIEEKKGKREEIIEIDKETS